MQFTIMHIAIFFILIPVGIGIWRYKYLEKEARMLLYLLFVVAINQFVSLWWVYYVEKNNLPFFFFYILIELLGISMIYYSYLKQLKSRAFIPVLVVLFFLCFIWSFNVVPEFLWTYSTYLRALEGMIVLVLISIYFINVYRKLEILNLYQVSGYWIGTGLFIYFASNLILFIFSELIFSLEDAIFQSIWAIHGILTILLYLFYSVAFICKKQEPKS